MKIYLYFEYKGGFSSLHLEGTSISAPVKGALYKPGEGQIGQHPHGESITEKLQVVVEGTRSAILATLSTFNQWLDSARREPLSEYERVYLIVESDAGSDVWRSRILDGRIETAPQGIATRELGRDRLTLVITRLNYWEAHSSTQVLVTNRSATRQVGVNLFNHTDAVSPHDNYLDILASDLSGDLPAPVELDLAHVNTAGRSVSQAWISLRAQKDALPAWLPLFECESGSPGAGIALASPADAGSSAGAFARLTGTLGAEMRLLSVAVSAIQMTWMRAKYYKPLLRLANNHAYSDLWLRAKVTSGSSNTVVYESAWVLSPAGEPLVEFGAIRMPPFLANANFSDALNLSLYAMKTSSAAVTLDLDFIQLSPLDGWNRLDLIEPIPLGYHLQEGEWSGSFKWDNATTYASPSHARIGSSLRLTPGLNHRLFFLHRAAAAMPIDTVLTAYLTYRPRKRNL